MQNNFLPIVHFHMRLEFAIFLAYGFVSFSKGILTYAGYL